ncbi:MAG: YdbH domain-containing protein [Gammaproteobacteria bacterium]
MPPPKPRYLALIPILALILACWLGREELAELVLSSSMRDYGLKQVSTQIDYLGLDTSYLKSVEFSVVTDTSELTLIAEDISMGYSLEQLTKGRADSLLINRLVISHQTRTGIPSGTVVAAEALAPVKIIAALRQALREYLVIDSLVIKHLSLNGESFGALHNKPLQLEATNADSVIASKLSLAEQHLTGKREIIRQLIVSRFTQDSLQAKLVLSQKPDHAVANIELEINDTHIKGKYFIDPKLLNDWLQPFVAINNIDYVNKVTGTLFVDFSADDQIRSSVTARADHFMLDVYRADNIEIKLKIRTPTRKPFQQLNIDKASYVELANLSQDGMSLAEARINLGGDLYTSTDAWQFEGEISAPSINANYQSQSLALSNIAARIRASSQNLNIEGNFSTAKVPADFSFAIEHDLANESGTLAIRPTTPINLNTKDDKLSHLLTPWPYPFDLSSGKIDLLSHASWSKNSDLTLNARVRVDNANGHYGEFVFSDLSVDHRLEILPTLRSLKPGEIFLTQLDSGVIVTNISTSFSLNTASTGSLPLIRVHDLYGEVLGGSFSGNTIVFDMNANTNRFKIEAEDIDLAAIVATQQLEGIEITGRVDGTIPIAINEQGIVIEHGAFFSDVRAGIIRYNPAGGTEQLSQNPLTGIALDALRDFRYSHLSADVDFKPDGTLTVNLKLKGTSPELDTKRPVHLNINTEQNLLSLLKSLRYAESVGASIDQKVQKKYNKSKQ